jgi:hypothetical protein
MRHVISGPNAYAHLIRAFAHRRPQACVKCRMPLPFWGVAAHGSEIRWLLPPASTCALGCHLIIAELWDRFANEYQIAAPSPAMEADLEMEGGLVDPLDEGIRP